MKQAEELLDEYRISRWTGHYNDDFEYYDAGTWTNDSSKATIFPDIEVVRKLLAKSMFEPANVNNYWFQIEQAKLIKVKRWPDGQEIVL